MCRARNEGPLLSDSSEQAGSHGAKPEETPPPLNQDPETSASASSLEWTLTSNCNHLPEGTGVDAHVFKRSCFEIGEGSCYGFRCLQCRGEEKNL